MVYNRNNPVNRNVVGKQLEIDNTEDNIYVNLNYKSLRDNQLSRFDFSPNQPFIFNGSNRYKVSVQRFNLDAFNLPVFKYRDSEYPDFSITLENNNNFDVIKRIEFLPDHNYPDTHENYYDIYTIQGFINMINKAIKDAYDELLTEDNTTLGGEGEPFLYYEDNKINMSFPTTMAKSQTGNKITMYFSKILFKYIKHLNFMKFNYNTFQEKYVEFEPQILFNNLDSTGNYILSKSIISNTMYMSPISTISLNISLNNRRELQLTNLNNKLDNSLELSDFTSDIQNAEQLRTRLYYFNKQEKRFHDIITHHELRFITVFFTYRDRYTGSNIEMRFNKDEGYNIKLLFKKQA